MALRTILTLLLSALLKCACAQDQPEHEKKAFVDSLGRYYQQATLPVYLMITSDPDRKGLPLQSTTRKAIKLEGHGVHTLRHMNHLSQTEDEFQVFADGTAPVSAVAFTQATTAQRGERTYYSSGLQVSLSAKDEMSGIETIYHSLNGAAFAPYQKSDFSKEGTYSYRFYATDRTGNSEKVKTRTFSVDRTAPVSYHHVISISSVNVISTNSSIYFTATDTLSGVAKTLYSFDKEPLRLYAGGNVAFQYLADGSHILRYQSVDAVGNVEAERTFEFYLDKTAPIMSADVLGDKFIVGDRVYFSGRTKLKLTAVDNKSGVKEVRYAMNDGDMITYQEPFYLPNRSGIHRVRFQAVDQTNNPVKDDFEHGVGIIYVDLTGPTLSHSFQGPAFTKADTVYISPRTGVLITGSDPEAGLKKLTYQLDGAADETPFLGKPLVIEKAGAHALAYAGYDNVNNKNERSVFFQVDVHGPEIQAQFAVAPSKDNKYPSYTSLFLSATDQEVGADQIRYRINGGKEQTYIAPLRGFAKNQEYKVEVTALDLLGNTSKTVIAFKTDRY